MQMWMIKVLMGIAASASLAVHAASHFDPVTSTDNEYTDTKTWVVDPFIVPPKGNPDREAIGKPGDFSEYRVIEADAGDRIKFIQRPIVSGSQIHGVYVVTDETAVADGACPSPNGAPCQPLTDGTNATECTGYVYGLPLVPMEGDGGFVYYTTDELGTVASQFGIDHGESAKTVMFACPWGSHCAAGMKVTVVVRNVVNGPPMAATPAVPSPPTMPAPPSMDNPSYGSYAAHFDPVTSTDNEYTDTKTWVVDPFIVPPKGNPDREAIGKPGDFSEYRVIEADAGDRIKFIQRPIVSGSQIHGVYVVTDETAVADEACPSPNGAPCQPLTDGTNATECTGYVYGLPLVPMEGDGGFVYYTTDELGTVASQFGIDHGESAKTVMFACPWGSHCAAGMKIKVVVRNVVNGPPMAATPAVPSPPTMPAPPSMDNPSYGYTIHPRTFLGLIALSIYVYQVMI